MRPGVVPVRDAFRGNFGDPGELGGAVCVMVDGRVVVPALAEPPHPRPGGCRLHMPVTRDA
jgi:hypothetical protein